jgi:cold shock CspA family protein
MRGNVVEVIIDRGFGFIEDEAGKRYFFHRGALDGVDFEELGAGTAVEFRVSEHAQGDEHWEGPRAVGIHLAEGEAPAVEHEVLPPGKTRS